MTTPSAMMKDDAPRERRAASSNWTRSTPAVAFFAITICRLIYIIAFQSENQPTPVDEIFVLLLAPIFFAGVRKFQQTFTKVACLFLVYVAINVVSALLSNLGGVPQPLAAISDAALDFKIFYYYFVFLALLSASEDIDASLDALSRAMITIALFNAVFVFYDTAVSQGTSILGTQLSERLGGYRPVGLFRHPWPSVILSLFSCFCAIYLAVRSGKRRFAAYALILAIAVLVSLSAKEVGALLSGMVLFGYWVGRRKRSRAAAIVLMSCVALIVVTLTPVGALLGTQIESYAGADGETRARTALTLKSVEIASEFFPLGTGGGTYASAPSYRMGYSEVYYAYGLDTIYGISPEKANYATDVFWPKIIAQGGFFGFFVYIVLFGMVFLPVFRLFNRYDGICGWLCGSVIASSLLISVAATPFSDETTYITISMIAAFALIKSRREELKGRRERHAS